MSAKKTTPAKKAASKVAEKIAKKVVILMGRYRGKTASIIPDKSLPKDQVKININEGPVITISKSFIK